MAFPKYPRRVFQASTGQLTESGHKWLEEIVKKFTTIDGSISGIDGSLDTITGAITVPAPGNLAMINADGDGFADSGIAAADVLTDAALEDQENYLTGDVALTLADTFYDGPSLSLDAGTWKLDGSVLADNDSASNRNVTVKLWDGTTVKSSAYHRFNANNKASISVRGTVELTSTTTWKISAAADGNACLIRATPLLNNTGCDNTASYLTAVKIA